MTAGGGQGWPGQDSSGFAEPAGAPSWQQPVQGQPIYPQPGQQPYGAPTYPAPQQPGYQQPGYQQPGYQQPGYPTSGQPTTGAPVYPAPGQPSTQAYPQQGYGPTPTTSQPVFGQAPYGQQPPTAWQPPAGPPPPGTPGAAPGSSGSPSKGGKNRLPVIITVVAVVVALLAAGLVWFFAKKNSDDAASGGQSTPVEAATQLLSALSQKDALGIAEGLDPTEAHLFADMSGDVLTQLKRLGIINDTVSSTSVGTTVTTTGITVDPTPIVINDHVSVVQLTGGTVTVKSGSGTLPFSDKLLAAFPELKESTKVDDTTINIADEVSKLGHPIRIATVNREGKWYVSLFYPAADNTAYTDNPDYKLGTPVPDTGGATPEDAMNTLLAKSTAGDISGVIGVLSPDEMGVLHDYGSLFLQQSGTGTGALDNAALSDMSWDVTDVTGGKKVSVKSLTITTNGQKYVIQRDPATGSLSVQAPGQGTVNITKDNIGTWITENTSDTQLPPQMLTIIQQEFPQVIGLGVVMVQAGDGKWYVSPLRTMSDVMVSLLKGLQPADIDYFISLAQGK
jgi:hypothetical protein